MIEHTRYTLVIIWDDNRRESSRYEDAGAAVDALQWHARNPRVASVSLSAKDLRESIR